MWKWMPFLCFLKGIKKRLGKRLEETSSPKGPSELQQERWKISSVNYWSETRLPSSVCQEIACPLAPPWKCDEAAEAVSGFPGRYTMLHVPMFFLLMPSPAETEWGWGGGAEWGERGELTGYRVDLRPDAFPSSTHQRMHLLWSQILTLISVLSFPDFILGFWPNVTWGMGVKSKHKLPLQSPQQHLTLLLTSLILRS